MARSWPTGFGTSAGYRPLRRQDAACERPEPAGYLVGNPLVGLEYAAIGALAGAGMGRLGATYFMFFLPNIDIGVAQDPLFFEGQAQGWAAALPGWAPPG